jgi:hypothetical protein
MKVPPPILLELYPEEEEGTINTLTDKAHLLKKV